jgi:hypothetical protein
MESPHGWINDWLLVPPLPLGKTLYRLNSNGKAGAGALYPGEPWNCANLWLQDPSAGALNMSLSDRKVYGSGADMAEYLVSWVNIGWPHGVLAGIWRILDLRETPADFIDPITGRPAAPESPYQYVMEATAYLEHLKWRLVIDWGRSINSVQHADRQNKRVVTVHEASILSQLLANLHTSAA